MRTLRRLFLSALGTALLVGSAAAAAITAQPAAAEPTDQFLFATGAGPGGGPHVRLFKADGTATSTSFYAFPAGFTGGVEVALGDLDGDGTPEIVTAAGPGGDAHVRIFDIHGTPIDKWSFYAYPNFHGGVHVATGDLNNDGKAEIVTGAGPGGGPHVRTWGLSGDAAVMKNERFAYGANMSAGVFVGTVRNGSSDSVLTGVGPGGGPHVKMFSSDLSTEQASFYAYDANYAGGVSVAGADVGATNEIVTSSLAFQGHVRSFKLDSTPSSISFYAFPGSNGGAQLGGIPKADPPFPFLAGTYTNGGSASGFQTSGASASAISPYGPNFKGGVRVGGGFGKFEDAAPAGTINITTTALKDGAKGAAYSDTAAATGGKTPYTWSVSAGALPAGLTLDPATGAITGTPTATGTTEFTLKVVDSSNPQLNATKALSIKVIDGLVIATTALDEGTVGASYSDAIEASGGTSPLSYAVTTGSLPAGLTLNPSTGAITGTPANAGTATFTVTVTDSSTPALTASKQLTLKVIQPLAITNPAHTDGVVGEPYALQLAATGGVPGYHFEHTGTLPAGLTMSEDGLISGTPTTEQTKTFTVKVIDAANPSGHEATRSVTIKIWDALTIDTTTLVAGSKGGPYTDTVDASGGTGDYQFSVTSGSLPAGLSLDGATGEISGTPTATGASTFTVRVVDDGDPAQQATKSLSITVTD